LQSSPLDGSSISVLLRSADLFLNPGDGTRSSSLKRRTKDGYNQDRKPDDQTTRTPARKPIHEIRLGRIKAAIWQNDTDRGTRYNVTVVRLYKDDTGIPSVMPPPLEHNKSLLDEMTSLAKERLEAVAGQCSAAGIRCSTDCRTGIPGEVVVNEAVAHDVLVLARRGMAGRARRRGWSPR